MNIFFHNSVYDRTHGIFLEKQRWRTLSLPRIFYFLFFFFPFIYTSFFFILFSLFISHPFFFLTLSPLIPFFFVDFKSLPQAYPTTTLLVSPAFLAMATQTPAGLLYAPPNQILATHSLFFSILFLLFLFKIYV